LKSDINDDSENIEDKPQSKNYVWVVALDTSIQILDKVFDFELNKKQQIDDKYIIEPWFQSVIIKGYLVAVE
jgi:hypothetical protein